jgi:hypothetical protein
MADDPERDILPVKEGASCERQRNISTSSLIGGRGNHYKNCHSFVKFYICCLDLFLQSVGAGA